ncbi:MAG TPA: TraG family conjugative transposon ATPase [Puia sp.]|nr:TraG family conjugative transposon ATPase [Puia sp.]
MTRNCKVRLPIWEVAADCILSEMGETTFVFALFKPEIFSLSEEQLNMIFQAWVKALQVLSPNTIVHIQDWYWQTKWRGDFEKDNGFLGGSSERYHHERPWMDHRCYVHVTRRPGRRMTSTSRALLQSSLTPQDTLAPEAIQDLASEVNQFMHILTDSGLLRCLLLSTNELVSTLDQAGHIERYCQLIMPDEKAAESRDVDFEGELRIGGYQCLFHTIADAEHLPAQCSPMTDHGAYSTEQVHFPISFAARLGLLLPCNHIYNQYLFIGEPAGARKKLETRRQRMHSLSAHSRVNALNRDAIDALLNESITDGKQLIKAHFNILSWTHDPHAVEPMRDMVAAAIARLGATPHLETLNRAELWYAGIPGNAADLPAYETFDILADQAICFLPQETNYEDSISAYGVRLGDRLSGRPLQVDLSDAPLQAGLIGNRNKAVFGGSGSGKSVTMNLLLQSYHEQGAHVLVVDIGNSYQGLCELSEGYYFTYTTSSPLQLNPFWIPFGEIPDIEKLESLKTLILALWKMEGEAIVRSELVTLSNALQLYYTKAAGDPFLFPCFNTFYEFLRDEFTKALAEDKVKNKDFDMDSFLYVLRPFYRGGEYDFLLNSKEQLDLLHQRFIVFELDVIKDHPILFPVVTLVIMEVFIGKMRKLPGVRKVILIEEAWKAIARQGMSEYLRYLFKTVRKFYGEAIVVTQEVDDIISSPVIKQAILNNTDCKILLDQSKFRNKFEQLQQLLGLSEKDKALVLSLNQQKDPQRKYKEVFIGLGANCSKVYRVELSLEQYLTFTTEEKEKLRVQQYARKYGGLRQGIVALATGLRNGSVRWLLTGALLLFSALLPSQRAHAQFPIADIIQAAIKKVIVATDLAIQRLQTETIALQNAQKMLENAMQLQRLTDIGDWVQHQKDLFEGYYQELWQVKNTLTLYHRVKDITEQQVQLVAVYKKAWQSIRQDPHFSTEELEHIGEVYDALLDRSIRQAAQLSTVVTAWLTQMDDSGRLRAIDQLQAQMNQNRRDLLAFTEENILLSLQRSKDEQEIRSIQTLYNIH